MPRPSDLTPEEVAIATREFEDLRSRPGVLTPGLDLREFLEAGIAGQWLAARMRRLGATVDEARAQTFAFGQVAAGAVHAGRPDAWHYASELLELYRSGFVLVPGEELADLIYDLVRRNPDAPA